MKAGFRKNIFSKMHSGQIFSDAKAKHKAFTLPEIIISISVIVMVITAATDILISVMRSNSENINTLIAYGLAQEGVEALRNIRDSDWVLGLNFDGAKPGNSQQVNSVWDNLIFDQNEHTSKYFAIHKRSASEMEGCTNQDLTSCAPWQLLAVNSGDFQIDSDLNPQIKLENFVATDLEKLLIYKNKTEQFSENSLNWGKANLIYNQFSNSSALTDFEPSSFYRMIIVDKLCFNKLSGPNCQDGENENLKFRVSSIVMWPMANGLVKQLVLSTELTDWKND